MRSLQDVQAVERDLIGRFVINPDLIDEHGINRNWFTLPESLLTLEAIDAVIRSGEVLSIPSLTAKLRDMTGGHDHLQRVVSWKSSAMPEHVLPEKIAFLKRESMLRDAQEALAEMQREIEAGVFSPEQSASVIGGLDAGTTSKYDFTAHQLTQKTVKHLIEAQHAAKEFGGMTGITTGITELDSLTGGFQRGDLIIFGAPPSMGKTAGAISMMVAQLEAKYKVGFFSLDMPSHKIGTRLFAAYSGFNLHHAKAMPDDPTDAQMASQGITDGAKFVQASDFYVNEKGGITISEIERQARQWHRLHGLDILYVDYLQRVRHDDPRMDKRLQVTDITERLKNLGKDLNVAVVALAQTNRALASRASKRPVMQDLAESAGIEREACLIIFAYRDAVYNENARKEDGEFLVVKHQDGPTGNIPVYWNAKCAKFSNHLEYSYA